MSLRRMEWTQAAVGHGTVEGHWMASPIVYNLIVQAEELANLLLGNGWKEKKFTHSHNTAQPTTDPQGAPPNAIGFTAVRYTLPCS